jgi:hypothetical protein
VNARLATALRGVREELRDVDSHPLVSPLVDLLHNADTADGVRLAEKLIEAFATDETSVAFTRLEQVVDHLQSRPVE